MSCSILNKKYRYILIPWHQIGLIKWNMYFSICYKKFKHNFVTPIRITQKHHWFPNTYGLRYMTSALTWRTFPERGSIMRSFLSLQLVASKLPSVLKDIQRTMSGWLSIIFTATPSSRFQIRICNIMGLSFRSLRVSSGCRGYLAVISGADQDAAAGGMPLNKPRPPAVTNEDHQSFGHVPPQTAIRNLPDSHLWVKGHSCIGRNVVAIIITVNWLDSHRTVLGAGRDDVVHERTPFDVHHAALVAADLWVMRVYSPWLRNNALIIRPGIIVTRESCLNLTSQTFSLAVVLCVGNI